MFSYICSSKVSMKMLKWYDIRSCQAVSSFKRVKGEGGKLVCLLWKNLFFFLFFFSIIDTHALEMDHPVGLVTPESKVEGTASHVIYLSSGMTIEEPAVESDRHIYIYLLIPPLPQPLTLMSGMIVFRAQLRQRSVERNSRPLHDRKLKKWDVSSISTVYFVYFPVVIILDGGHVQLQRTHVWWAPFQSESPIEINSAIYYFTPFRKEMWLRSPTEVVVYKATLKDRWGYIYTNMRYLGVCSQDIIQMYVWQWGYVPISGSKMYIAILSSFFFTLVF